MLRKEVLSAWLTDPYVDKAVAFVGVSPHFYNLYDFYRLALKGDANIYTTVVAAHLAIIVFFALIRRAPSRVSLRPMDWIITAGRTYWIWLFFHLPLATASVALAPSFFIRCLVLSSIAVMIAGRFSIGRNIGLVPAQREIVTSGAYGYVRHPIHAGTLLFLLSFILAYFSLMNFVLAAVGIAFVIWKSFIEERFLAEDESYREYMRKVKYRWIPGIA